MLYVLIVGLLFATVAQFKTPGGFWYSNTLCGHCIRWFFRFAMWLEKWLSETCFPFLGKVLKKCWKIMIAWLIWSYRYTEKAGLWIIEIMGRVFRWTGGKVHRFLSLLPLTWQWLLAGSLAMLLIFATEGHFISIVFGLCLILYASHCFGLLAESTRPIPAPGMVKLRDSRRTGRAG